MSMPHQAWSGAAAGYLGMWMAMMVPMMLPSLVPMMLQFRRSVRGANDLQRHGLTALAGVGYYTIWATAGVAAWAAGTGIMAIELRWAGIESWVPAATGALLLVAGAVQFTGWKVRQLARCGPGAECCSATDASAVGAWTDGLRMGMRCALCCGNLMLALLGFGTMHLVAMAAVTLAIAAERLAPWPLRAAQVSGVAMLALGVLRLVRA